MQRNELWAMHPKQSSSLGQRLTARLGQHPQLTAWGQRAWLGWGPSHTAPGSTRLPPVCLIPWWVVTRSPVTHALDTLTQLSRWFPAIAANGSHLGNGSGDTARRVDGVQGAGWHQAPSRPGPGRTAESRATGSTQRTGSTRHLMPPGPWHPALSPAGLAPCTPMPQPGRELPPCPAAVGQTPPHPGRGAPAEPALCLGSRGTTELQARL